MGCIWYCSCDINPRPWTRAARFLDKRKTFVFLVSNDLFKSHRVSNIYHGHSGEQPKPVPVLISHIEGLYNTETYLNQKESLRPRSHANRSHHTRKQHLSYTLG